MKFCVNKTWFKMLTGTYMCMSQMQQTGSASPEATGRGTHILPVPTFCIPTRCRRKRGDKRRWSLGDSVQGRLEPLPVSQQSLTALQDHWNERPVFIHHQGILFSMCVEMSGVLPASGSKSRIFKMVQQCFFLSSPILLLGRERRCFSGYSSSLCGHRAPPDTKSREPAFRES